MTEIWNAYNISGNFYLSLATRTMGTRLILHALLLLPPASEGWGKVLFSACLSGHTWGGGEGYLPWTGGGYLLWTGGRVPTLDGGGGTYLGLGVRVSTSDGGEGVPTSDGGGGTYLGWGRGSMSKLENTSQMIRCFRFLNGYCTKDKASLFWRNILWCRENETEIAHRKH